MQSSILNQDSEIPLIRHFYTLFVVFWDKNDSIQEKLQGKQERIRSKHENIHGGVREAFPTFHGGVRQTFSRLKLLFVNN